MHETLHSRPLWLNNVLLRHKGSLTCYCGKYDLCAQ